MKLHELPDFFISKIICYLPLEDIFSTAQYINHEFRTNCNEYTLPTEIDTSKYPFLSTNQMCQLIKNSIGLRHFHYHGRYRTVRAESAIFEHLYKYSKSLKILSITRCDVYESSAFCLLLASGPKLRELNVNSGYQNIHNSLSEFNELPSLRGLQKLRFKWFQGGFERCTLKKIYDSCPNLTTVTLCSSHIPVNNELISYLIQERGSQLRSLCYNERRDEAPLQDLIKCTQLKTLDVYDVFMDNPNIKLPTFFSVQSLALREMTISDNVYPNILKSFPNLTQLTLEIYRKFGTETAKCIARYTNLKRLTLCGDKGRNNDLVLVFRRCKGLKFARIESKLLDDLSKEEVTECFAGLHTLEVFYGTEDAESLAERFANWLPQTKVYMYYRFRDGIEGLRKKIKTTQCHFH